MRIFPPEPETYLEKIIFMYAWDKAKRLFFIKLEVEGLGLKKKLFILASGLLALLCFVYENNPKEFRALLFTVAAISVCISIYFALAEKKKNSEFFQVERELNDKNYTLRINLSEREKLEPLVLDMTEK